MIARRADRLALGAAAATFVFHLVANPHYGFFRDELYFIMCGFRPDFGYVDQPPLVPLLAAATQLGGHSLVLLRAVPALLAAGAVYVAMALAAELGGGAFARIATAIVVALAPVLASFGGKVSTDEANPLLWTLSAYALLRVVRARDDAATAARWGAVAGIALGVSLETKYSGVFWIAGLLAGLAATPERRVFRSRAFVLASVLAAAIAAPSAIWQMAHGLPILELLRNGQHGKNVVVSPLAFVGQQILIVGPLYAPVWIAGVVRLALERSARFLAIAFTVLIALMIVLHGKHYYPAAVYPIPLAAGCVALERGLARVRGARIVQAAAACALFAGGAVFIPLVLPVLPEFDAYVYQTRLMQALHVSRAATATEHHAESALSQDFADMHGWPELASAVGGVVATLTPEERAHAVIVASNYGEAAALEFFGRGLPPVASGHNQYFLWGPRVDDPAIVIDVHGDCGAHDHLFQRVDGGAVTAAGWAISYEQGAPILVCRGPRVPLRVLWPTLKEYI